MAPDLLEGIQEASARGGRQAAQVIEGPLVEGGDQAVRLEPRAGTDAALEVVLDGVRHRRS